ncbi:MAG: hypothetical protein ACREPM_02325 [Gemmatimonadaceae bacterium]
MADSSSSNPPARRIDRAALERVLARASELQVGSGDTPDEFTEEQLLDLGKEVGLSPQHLRQALAEEKTRSIVPDDESGVSASLFGPSRVRADRTVSGKSEDVLGSIDAWMQRTELLIVKRHHTDRIVWEPRHDFLVGIKRALRVGGRDYTLSQAFEASATVVQVDDARVHVGLDADFRTSRRRSAESVIGSTAVGAAATGALFLMGVMAAVAVAPVVVLPLAGIAGARALQSRVVDRAQLALEQLLDRLERGELGRRGPDSLLGAIVAAATSAVPPRRF